MKLIHTADLHIGKIVNEFSMLQDQRYILEEMLTIVKEEHADAIIIAGDVYDRSIPPADAVILLDWFLNELIQMNVKVFLISGNHDSPERIGFASDLLDHDGLYIAGVFKGDVKKVPITKGDEKVNLYLLPFLKPQTVRYYKETTENRIKDSVARENLCENDEVQENVETTRIHTFEDGVKACLSDISLDKSECNILVTHHFVTSNGQVPEQSDSETNLSLGGIDQVDISVFDDFDYVALGHIHRPQRIGRDTIRYAGSPLKYSFSEANHNKCVTILEIHNGKDLTIRTRALTPLHDMRKIKGNLCDLMNPDYYELADTNDYIQATITDTIELMDPIGTLRSVYPNVMQIILEKNQVQNAQVANNYGERKSKSPMELFEEFYTLVTNREFDEKRQEIMKDIIEATMGGDRL